MALLKKLKSATLIETLVSSGIILIVFVIGSMTINNIFQSSIKNNDDAFRSRINELQYLSLHHKIKFPFFEDTDLWDITIEKKETTIILKGVNKKNKIEKVIVIESD